MNADEARFKALSVNTNETNSQYTEAQKTIAEAVGFGKYECWFCKTMKSDVQKKLESEGFVIGSHVSDRDGTMVKISWTKLK